MTRSYPIWNDVEACIYKSNKSWGARDTCAVDVRVGTSRSNSELLVQHFTTRRQHGPYTVFRFGVNLDDGHGPQTLKTMWMHTKTKVWHDREPAELREVA